MMHVASNSRHEMSPCKSHLPPLQSQLELGGQAVVPDMMYRTLDIFNPLNAKLIRATAAGQELTMAQKLSRGVQKVAKQREQEDAQEFLTFLLDSTHQELLKLRAMYGSQGEHRNLTISSASVCSMGEAQYWLQGLGLGSCFANLVVTRWGGLLFCQLGGYKVGL